MRDPELWQIVLIRFPKWEKEKTCRMERTMREAARESMYKRLINERQAAKAVLDELGKTAADSRKEV